MGLLSPFPRYRLPVIMRFRRCMVHLGYRASLPELLMVEPYSASATQ